MFLTHRYSYIKQSGLNFVNLPRDRLVEWLLVQRQPLCLYPNLNADREGPGTSETMAKYVAFQQQLDDLAKAVRDAYRDYRSAVKLYLYL